MHVTHHIISYYWSLLPDITLMSLIRCRMLTSVLLVCCRELSHSWFSTTTDSKKFWDRDHTKICKLGMNSLIFIMWWWKLRSINQPFNHELKHGNIESLIVCQQKNIFSHFKDQWIYYISSCKYIHVYIYLNILHRSSSLCSSFLALM